MERLGDQEPVAVDAGRWLTRGTAGIAGASLLADVGHWLIASRHAP